MDETLLNRYSTTKVSIRRRDDCIEGLRLSMTAMCCELEMSQECCTSQVRALERAAAHKAALKAHNAHLQIETAEVRC